MSRLVSDSEITAATCERRTEKDSTADFLQKVWASQTGYFKMLNTVFSLTARKIKSARLQIVGNFLKIRSKFHMKDPVL